VVSVEDGTLSNVIKTPHHPSLLPCHHVAQDNFGLEGPWVMVVPHASSFVAYISCWWEFSLSLNFYYPIINRMSFFSTPYVLPYLPVHPSTHFFSSDSSSGAFPLCHSVPTRLMFFHNFTIPQVPQQLMPIERHSGYPVVSLCMCVCTFQVCLKTFIVIVICFFKTPLHNLRFSLSFASPTRACSPSRVQPAYPYCVRACTFFEYW